VRKRLVVAVALAILLAASTYAGLRAIDIFELAKIGTQQSVQAAINQGADVNVRDKDGLTPLMYAARQNPNHEVTAALLRAGAEINAGDLYGRSALMYAARWNPNPEVISALLKAGADFEAPDLFLGQTGLMSAAQFNPNPEVITALLKVGANVKARDYGGDSALVYAALSKNAPEAVADVIAALLKAGADVNAKNSMGKTALDVMRENEKLRDTNAYQLLVAATLQPAHADTTGPRFALVIGNSGYTGMPRLKNPVNDATDLTVALKRLGFRVTLLTDASRKAMNQAIVAFREALARDQQSEGIFFFAGHGVQSNGVNYLIPVGADIKAEVDLDDEAVSAQKILGSLEDARNRVNLVILDACRDNPLPSMMRSAARGLAVVTSAPSETLILYSTAAGQTAADGEGRNSPFAQALLSHIADAGDITQTAKVITGEVKKATGGKQTPYVYMGLSVDFTLNRGQATSPKKPLLTVDKAYASVTVEVHAKGTLYIGDTSLGQLSPGSFARIDDVEAGQVRLEMRYADGRTETRSVNVSKNAVAAVSFSYVERPKVSENMAFVEGGAFMMGDTLGDNQLDEKPVHSAALSSYFIGKYEVTFDEYDEFSGSTGRKNSGDQGWGRGPRPAINVSWYDAVEYCNWLSKKEGLEECYTVSGSNITCDFNTNGYRLPTETEWEYAGRGGNRTYGYKYAGSGDVDVIGWHSGNSGGRTQPAGQKRPNELGLSDMSGNVWEWCWDWYGNYASHSPTNPTGAASGTNRVLRGGSWLNGPYTLRTSGRNSLGPDSSSSVVGFRIATRAFNP
jgi:formylglycine-generating enzyme required for sulfatase activity/ankyrin repeat protein